uniref:Rho GDP-dissociation inhibitor 1 n=1 Tax=Aplanochytrium stocchinoi TaxID=215587 RepID=A0A7S3LJ34_9STRA|mmetsp:Transcript_795/g.951  ORF Transcript_795/g.951 Transcript_795/m.951 type:complete len:208 (+) Transcript_795:61-684(+)
MDENSSDLVNQTEELSLDNSSDDKSVDYKISNKASSKVDEILKKDASDESLKRYKESLLGAAAKGDLGNTDDPRRVVLKEFRTIFEDDETEDYICENPTDAEGKIAFEMKENCKYRIRIGFAVQHEIVSGLNFKLKVKRAVFKKTEKVVMGSYGPRSETHYFEFPRNEWLEAPAGKLSRGEYKCYIQLEDADFNKHAELAFHFKIVK